MWQHGEGVQLAVRPGDDVVKRLAAYLLPFSLALGCGSASDAGGARTTLFEGARTTLAEYDTGVASEEKLRADSVPSERTEVPDLVGLSKADAIAEAEERGWVQVEVMDFDSDGPWFQAMYLAPHRRITLEVRNGVVERATAG